MVLAPKNGIITIGNEVDLEYHDHSNSSTSVQKWRFLTLYFEFGEGFISWGVFKNVESGLFLTSRSNTNLTIEQGKFKPQKLYPYLLFSNTTCIFERYCIPIKMEWETCIHNNKSFLYCKWNLLIRFGEGNLPCLHFDLKALAMPSFWAKIIANACHFDPKALPMPSFSP